MTLGKAPISDLILRIARSAEKLGARVRGKGYGSSSIMQENKFVHRLLGKAPSLAVDIGGNIGDYTAELRRRNPALEIHTFEPASVNCETLRTRFANDAKVVIVPCAVSDQAGSATLFSNEAGSGLASLTQRRLDHFNIDFSVREAIATMCFEDYWNEALQRRNIDIVKIDIEGHELSALRGFGDAIRAASVIQFEFGGCNIDTRTYFQDFWYFFKERDFDIYRIAPFGLEEIKRYRETEEFFSTTNYIARNKRA